jgi:hypothetical protein
MMSLPTKKTEAGTSFAKPKILKSYVEPFGTEVPHQSARLAATTDTEASKRRVTVEQAAHYAGVGRTKMYELIIVDAVVSGHRPGSNRRWVDLDSVDELYRSPERMREAEEKIRRRREERKDREEGND